MAACLHDANLLKLVTICRQVDVFVGKQIWKSCGLVWVSQLQQASVIICFHSVVDTTSAMSEAHSATLEIGDYVAYSSSEQDGDMNGETVMGIALGTTASLA